MVYLFNARKIKEAHDKSNQASKVGKCKLDKWIEKDEWKDLLKLLKIVS